MKIVASSLSSPRFMKKFRLILTWKDPKRVEFSENSLDAIRGNGTLKFDYNNRYVLDMLCLIAEFPNPSVQSALANRRDPEGLPEIVQWSLVKSNDYNVLSSLSQRGDLTPTTTFQLLEKAFLLEKTADASSTSQYILRNIVDKDSTTGATLNTIANNTKNSSVLRLIAGHVNVPEDLLFKLVESKKYSIAIAALRNSRIPPEIFIRKIDEFKDAKIDDEYNEKNSIFSESVLGDTILSRLSLGTLKLEPNK